MGEADNPWVCLSFVLLPVVGLGIRAGAAEGASRLGRVRGWTMYVFGLLGWYLLGGGICAALRLQSDGLVWLALLVGGCVGLTVGWYLGPPVYRALGGESGASE